MTKIAIIGAGLSGLTAATLLKDYADITLFEKARGVSGRMSTRRATPYSFDHGAQYFTARTKAFQNFIQPMIKEKIIERWNARYKRFDGVQEIDSDCWATQEPRYVGSPSMNAMAKYLAHPLKIHLKTRICAIEKKQKWQLTDEENNIYQDFDWVICTAPAQQASDLLSPLSFKEIQTIQSIQMTPCFALMLGFKHPLSLEFDAAHVLNSDIGWIAVNSQKPARNTPYTLVIHASPEYSKKQIDSNHEYIIDHLCTQASILVRHDLNQAEHKTVHLWRYANNVVHNSHELLVDVKQQIGVCGDWCQGGRVEGAFTSAHQLCQAILTSIQHKTNVK